MLQLASTCEAMGIPKDTVKTLRRWDRVHMIKELAGVAVRTIPIVGLLKHLLLVSFCLPFLGQLAQSSGCCSLSCLCLSFYLILPLSFSLSHRPRRLIVQLDRTEIVYSGGRKRERSEHLRAIRAKEAAQCHDRQGPLPGVSMTCTHVAEISDTCSACHCGFWAPTTYGVAVRT